MSDDDFFTPSIIVKSVPKTAPPKKELSESDKKALSAAVFDTGHKELSLGDDNSDLFTGASPATSKAQTSNMGRIGLAILIYNYIKLLGDYVLFGSW